MRSLLTADERNDFLGMDKTGVGVHSSLAHEYTIFLVIVISFQLYFPMRFSLFLHHHLSTSNVSKTSSEAVH